MIDKSRLLFLFVLDFFQFVTSNPFSCCLLLIVPTNYENWISPNVISTLYIPVWAWRFPIVFSVIVMISSLSDMLDIPPPPCVSLFFLCLSRIKDAGLYPSKKQKAVLIHSALYQTIWHVIDSGKSIKLAPVTKSYNGHFFFFFFFWCRVQMQENPWGKISKTLNYFSGCYKVWSSCQTWSVGRGGIERSQWIV